MIIARALAIKGLWHIFPRSTEDPSYSCAACPTQRKSTQDQAGIISAA